MGVRTTWSIMPSEAMLELLKGLERRYVDELIESREGALSTVSIYGTDQIRMSVVHFLSELEDQKITTNTTISDPKIGLGPSL